jgi:hypothetical protein
MDEIGAVGADEVRPALAEVPSRDDEVPLAGVDEIGYGRLERARSGSGEEQDVVLGAEDLLQPRETPLVRDLEVGPAMVHHRLGHHRQHLGRHRSRAGREQVALLGHRGLGG